MIHGHTHHHLGDKLFGRAGAETDQGCIGGDADGADGVQFHLLAEDHADGNHRNQSIRAAEGAQIHHQDEQAGDQEQLTLVLQLVNGKVQQVVEGAGGQDQAGHGAHAQDGADHLGRPREAAHNQHQHLPDVDGGLVAQITELVSQHIAFCVGGELAGGHNVGQDAGYHQQAQHDPEQVGHFKRFLCGWFFFCLFHNNSPRNVCS